MNKRTVFIIGAGASVPYGFPDGRKLRNNIINNFSDEFRKLSESLKSAFTENEYRDLIEKADEFVNIFDQSRTYIDLFLTRRDGDFNLFGKMAIYNEILKAERTCNFRRINADVDWYYWFFNYLTKDIISLSDINRLLNRNICFITFNYDRLIERYLQSALLANFGRDKVSIENVNDLMNRIPIFHVYNSLGKLDWQKSNSEIVPWGMPPEYNKIKSNSDKIGIMHTDRESNFKINIIDEIKDAKRVFFLGFSFAPENLDQIDVPEIFNRGDKEIYATAYNYTDKEIEEVKRSLVPDKSIKNQPIVKNTDCLGLLREFYINN